MDPSKYDVVIIDTQTGTQTFSQHTDISHKLQGAVEERRAYATVKAKIDQYKAAVSRVGLYSTCKRAGGQFLKTMHFKLHNRTRELLIKNIQFNVITLNLNI